MQISNHKFSLPKATQNGTTDSVDGVQEDVVGYAYFSASLAVWFAMPLLFLPFAYANDEIPTPCGNIKIPKLGLSKDESCLPLPLQYVITCLWLYALAVITVYFVIPGTDIYEGVKKLFCSAGSNDDGDKAKVKLWKRPQQLGEGISQLVIAMIFYLGNADWLPQKTKEFGIFTMVMSFGSALMGLGGVCYTCYKKF